MTGAVRDGYDPVDGVYGDSSAMKPCRCSETASRSIALDVISDLQMQTGDRAVNDII